MNPDIIFMNPVVMHSQKYFNKGALIMHKKELITAIAQKTEPERGARYRRGMGERHTAGTS